MKTLRMQLEMDAAGTVAGPLLPDQADLATVYAVRQLACDE